MKSFVKDKKLKLKSKILKALLGKWYTSSLVMIEYQRKYNKNNNLIF